MKLLLAIILALLAGSLAAPTVFGWSPMTVSGDCHGLWTVQGQSEADLTIDFADNAAFAGYTQHELDSTTFSVQISTPLSVTQVWVRWHDDPSVISTGNAPGDCHQNPTPPTGSIGGPCADPAYYGIFDNTAGSVAYKFRLRWLVAGGHLRTKVKTVPAGMIFRTWEHWAKPYTTIRVAYLDGTTWQTLATKVAVKGRYKPCEYQHGFSTP